MFEIFMNRFRKSVSELSVVDDGFNCDGSTCKWANFKVKEKFISNRSEWIHIDFLLSLDCQRIYTYQSNFSAEDLNKFIRSWQEGKTNHKLKLMECKSDSSRDVKEALKDCRSEMMDPRTTRVKYK
uniref:FBA_2 domain-containing protein n=1 Tax=Caenorhabditis tropicalis TaxID=1561998 RepID=A0A1I7V1B8_9PELO